ncbi:hypothetical protein J6590_068817 [Homalodisca vitripennis]|nr:hypothetical protein J6590_068817 [Homalodisca vitripennis]
MPHTRILVLASNINHPSKGGTRTIAIRRFNSLVNIDRATKGTQLRVNRKDAHSASSIDRATKGTQPRVNVSIGRMPYRQLLLMNLSAFMRHLKSVVAFNKQHRPSYQRNAARVNVNRDVVPSTVVNEPFSHSASSIDRATKGTQLRVNRKDVVPSTVVNEPFSHSASSIDRATKGTQPRVNVSIGRMSYRQLLLMNLSAFMRHLKSVVAFSKQHRPSYQRNAAPCQCVNRKDAVPSLLLMNLSAFMRHLKSVVAFSKQHRPNYQRNAAPRQCVNRKDVVPSLLLMNLSAFMRHLKSVVAFSKQHRPSYQRNAAPCQCVNRKDAVPSTVVNEPFSHSASSIDRATKGTQPRVNVSIGRMPYRQLLLMNLSAFMRHLKSVVAFSKQHRPSYQRNVAPCQCVNRKDAVPHLKSVVAFSKQHRPSYQRNVAPCQCVNRKDAVPSTVVNEPFGHSASSIDRATKGTQPRVNVSIGRMSYRQLLLMNLSAFMRHLKSVVAFSKQHRPSYQRNAAPCQCVNRKDVVPSLLLMNLSAFMRHLKSVVAFSKQHRPSYQRNAAPRQCVNRKDVVPSTVVNEPFSHSASSIDRATKGTQPRVNVSIGRMSYRQLLLMNLSAFMRHLKSVVAFSKQHRPSYQRNVAPCQCVNRKDAVPSTVVNEPFSHSASSIDRATKGTQPRVNVSIGRMSYRQLLLMNLSAFMRHLKSVVAFSKQHRPSYQRNAAPCQCVNRKDAVPSTVVNEPFSVYEEIGRMATPYIPSDWRLFTYISI